MTFDESKHERDSRGRFSGDGDYIASLPNGKELSQRLTKIQGAVDSATSSLEKNAAMRVMDDTFGWIQRSIPSSDNRRDLLNKLVALGDKLQ
jgi:hypothetical protein